MIAAVATIACFDHEGPVMSISALIDEALATADTIRSTPFAAAAPEAACALAERSLELLAAGADVDGAREAAENAAYTVESIAHDEIAEASGLNVASAFAPSEMRPSRSVLVAAFGPRRRTCVLLRACAARSATEVKPRGRSRRSLDRK